MEAIEAAIAVTAAPAKTFFKEFFFIVVFSFQII
jgi:hypothetical protein